MRGEKFESFIEHNNTSGSPPHARGKVGNAHLIAQHFGITPACAGKSKLPRFLQIQSGDHPRMRGEKRKNGKRPQKRRGSPPHARGKAPGWSELPADGGITPACAGKRLKHIHYLLYSCAKHLFTLQFCVDDLCHLAVSHSTVPLYIR